MILHPYPQRINVPKVAQRRKDGDANDRDPRSNHAPVRSRQWFLASTVALYSGGQMPVAAEIRYQPCKHENGGSPEAVVPTIDLRKKAAQQRTERRADVDPGAEVGG